ncbi:hypothetical protein Q7P37_002324 [Cladosporium fusiforme]
MSPSFDALFDLNLPLAVLDGLGDAVWNKREENQAVFAHADYGWTNKSISRTHIHIKLLAPSTNDPNPLPSQTPRRPRVLLASSSPTTTHVLLEMIDELRIVHSCIFDYAWCSPSAAEPVVSETGRISSSKAEIPGLSEAIHIGHITATEQGPAIPGSCQLFLILIYSA